MYTYMIQKILIFKNYGILSLLTTENISEHNTENYKKYYGKYYKNYLTSI